MNTGLGTSPGLGGFDALGGFGTSPSNQGSEGLTLKAAEDSNLEVVFNCKKVYKFSFNN